MKKIKGRKKEKKDKRKTFVKKFKGGGTNIKLHFKTKLDTKKQKTKPNIPFGKFIVYAISINLILIILIFIFRNHLPPQIPLFYGLPEGKEQLASSLTLTLPSLLSLTILLLNLGLSFIIQEEFIKKALILSSLLVALFSLITTLKIFFLIGNI